MQVPDKIDELFLMLEANEFERAAIIFFELTSAHSLITQVGTLKDVLTATNKRGYIQGLTQGEEIFKRALKR